MVFLIVLLVFVAAAFFLVISNILRRNYLKVLIENHEINPTSPIYVASRSAAASLSPKSFVVFDPEQLSFFEKGKKIAEIKYLEIAKVTYSLFGGYNKFNIYRADGSALQLSTGQKADIASATKQSGGLLLIFSMFSAFGGAVAGFTGAGASRAMLAEAGNNFLTEFTNRGILTEVNQQQEVQSKKNNRKIMLYTTLAIIAFIIIYSAIYYFFRRPQP